MSNPNEIEALEAIQLVESIEYAKDSIVSRTLHRAENSSITIFAFDQGQDLSEHTSPYNAFVYILDGEAELKIGGEIHNVQTGQIIKMPAGIPHAVKANKAFKMLLIMLK